MVLHNINVTVQNPHGINDTRFLVEKIEKEEAACYDCTVCKNVFLWRKI